LLLQRLLSKERANGYSRCYGDYDYYGYSPTYYSYNDGYYGYGRGRRSATAR